ncbi:probable chitinase 3 [Pseudomyrmex gracilis]|uniref:probable chitinase 3 n=1 Tax=Pseudomyrmex gracilis TaxID=219809 RepID=UPI00099549C8|nr:probable chitinase 3 [Pseudomyrmex gracilis]
MKSSIILLCLVMCSVPLVMTQVQAHVLPYPGDCTKYQQCDNSGCFVMSCGIGTEFNPAIGTCDYPLRDRSGCNNRG